MEKLKNNLADAFCTLYVDNIIYFPVDHILQKWRSYCIFMENMISGKGEYIVISFAEYLFCRFPKNLLLK
ncbi:MAG TPA: hypothetical protein DDY68_04810 [Porphyromonadaceae bacterium]|nr:hypothetical protein [Porphyromonadaceae bacterium]